MLSNESEIANKSHELSLLFNIRYEIVFIILLSGYTLCQDDILSSKGLSTDKTMSK